MPESTCIILEGSTKDCLEIPRQILELSDNQYDEAEYDKRLSKANQLLLIAKIDKSAVGFKVSYRKEQAGSFYSLMGGIVPDYRQQKVAPKLADAQEEWAKSQGYTAITFKTRNYLKPTLIFALKNGFNIIDVIPKDKIFNHRIILKKLLNE
ncbi:MAG: GNAT family N-acetyltransferase [Spirosomataceae bacterium]